VRPTPTTLAVFLDPAGSAPEATSGPETGRGNKTPGGKRTRNDANKAAQKPVAGSPKSLGRLCGTRDCSQKDFHSGACDPELPLAMSCGVGKEHGSNRRGRLSRVEGSPSRGPPEAASTSRTSTRARGKPLEVAEPGAKAAGADAPRPPTRRSTRPRSVPKVTSGPETGRDAGRTDPPVKQTSERRCKSDVYQSLKPGAVVTLVQNNKLGHHDVTYKDNSLKGAIAIVVEAPVYPNTWLSVKLKDTRGDVVKVRTSQLAPLDQAGSTSAPPAKSQPRSSSKTTKATSAQRQAPGAAKAKLQPAGRSALRKVAPPAGWACTITAKVSSAPCYVLINVANSRTQKVFKKAADAVMFCAKILMLNKFYVALRKRVAYLGWYVRKMKRNEDGAVVDVPLRAGKGTAAKAAPAPAPASAENKRSCAVKTSAKKAVPHCAGDKAVSRKRTHDTAALPERTGGKAAKRKRTSDTAAQPTTPGTSKPPGAVRVVFNKTCDRCQREHSFKVDKTQNWCSGCSRRLGLGRATHGSWSATAVAPDAELVPDARFHRSCK